MCLVTQAVISTASNNRIQRKQEAPQFHLYCHRVCDLQENPPRTYTDYSNNSFLARAPLLFHFIQLLSTIQREYFAE